VAARSPATAIEEAVDHERQQLLIKMQSLPLKVKKVCHVNNNPVTRTKLT
jgi:hypothetical protein